MSDDDDESRPGTASNDDDGSQVPADDDDASEAGSEIRKRDRSRSASKPDPDEDGDDHKSDTSLKTLRTRTSHLLDDYEFNAPSITHSVNESSMGLRINPRFGMSSYDDYDVITVHGIRDDPQTAWLTKDDKLHWVPLQLFRDLTTRQIDFSYHTHEDADIYKPRGIGIEAERLLEAYVVMKNELPETEADRPVIWIAHDIGGQIVKQALIYAAMEPQKFKRIAVLTTAIIFLGVPHRATSEEEYEDQLHQLLMLPGPSAIKKGIVLKVKGLATAVKSINDTFYETNMNSRAHVINIFSLQPPEDLREAEESRVDPEAKALPENEDPNVDVNVASQAPEATEELAPTAEEKPVDRLVIAPFPRYNASMGYPFEHHNRWRDMIDHLDLVKGDFAGTDEESWVGKFNKQFNTTGFSLQVNYKLVGEQAKVLSLVPPRRTPNIAFDPSLPKDPLVKWINAQPAYKSFNRKSVGPATLYIHGDEKTSLREIRHVSRLFFTDYDFDRLIEYNVLSRCVLFFEFDKRDSRYSSIRSMLTTFLNDIIWHFWGLWTSSLSDVFELANAFQAWSLNDLWFAFKYLRDYVSVEDVTFYISCFDQCPEEEREWFINSMMTAQSFSEATWRTIIITNRLDGSLKKTLQEPAIIDLAECEALRKLREIEAERETWELGNAMEGLLAMRPRYRDLEEQVKDLIGQCKDNVFLGRVIINWLADGWHGHPTGKLEKMLASLAPVSLHNTIHVIIKALSPEKRDWARLIYHWIKHAAEPLTLEALAQAIALSLSPPQEVEITDLNFGLFKEDVLRTFGGLVFLDGREFRLAEDALYEVDNGTTETDVQAIHKQMAETCLRSLTDAGSRAILAETMSVQQTGGLDTGAVMFPRISLAEYAVRFWAKHYLLAGPQAPVDEALGFFRDRKALYIWAEAYYVASNPFTRNQKSYFTPLPYMAMLGLEELLFHYIEVEKSQPAPAHFTNTKNQQYWESISEAIRNGHNELALRLLELVEMDHTGMRDAIWWAAAYGKGGILDVLVAKARGVEGFKWPEKLLGRAVTADLESLVSALAEAGFDVNERVMSDRTTALGTAVFLGSRGASRILLEHKADMTLSDDEGGTPLLSAAQRGDPIILQMLLDAGADVNMKDDKGATAVHCAVDFARPQALELLIKAGVDFNVGNTDDESKPVYTRFPIVHAADCGYETSVRILLDAGADATATSLEGTALYCAAREGHTGVCRMLLEKGAEPNQSYPNQDTLILRAIATKKKELVELLIDNPWKKAEINSSDPSGPYFNTPLTRAIESDLTDVFKLLLDHGADVNYVGKDSDSPLLASAHFRHPEMAKTLLARGANVHWCGNDKWTPLHSAFDSPPIVKMLLEHGAEIDRQSNDGTVLMIASRFNAVAVVKILLARTPKPDLELALSNEDHKDHSFTALLIACRYAQPECVKLLLEAGAKVDAKTKDGSYALEFCLETSKPDAEKTLNELLKVKPNLQQVDDDGNTVLHGIISDTPLSTVQMLVERGAPVDAANKGGYTPLAVAVEKGNTAIARYFIQQCKVNVKVYGPKFGSILHLAVSQGNLELTQLLIGAKADHSAVDRDYGESVLYTALRCEDPLYRGRIVRYLVETVGVDVNARGGRAGYPIMLAATEPLGKMMKYLIRREADVNVADDLGRRPIHVAAATSEYNIMALVEAGAEINVRDRYGRSPLHMAAGLGGLPVLEMLLSPPPEENFQTKHLDNDGWTPLMWGCRSFPTTEDFVKLLMDDAGECLWARSRDNQWSALKLARYHSYFGGADVEEMYKFLMPPDGKRTRKNKDGQEEVWNDAFHKSESALRKFGGKCSSCYLGIFGLQWKCIECTDDYILCFKCVADRATMHTKEHHFEEIGPEFATPPHSVAESNSEEHSGVGNAESEAEESGDESLPASNDDDDSAEKEDETRSASDDDSEG